MTAVIPEMNEKIWRTGGTPDLFSTTEVFEHAVNESLSDDFDVEVGLGTDSQIIGRTFRFITVMCIYRVGHGGNYYYLPEDRPRSKYIVANQKMRMFDEVAKTIEYAFHLQENTGIDAIVHVDASPEHHKEFTSEFSDQLKGYVQACGFSCLLKPDSYVANCVADRHTKKKSKKKERRMQRRLTNVR